MHPDKRYKQHKAHSESFQSDIGRLKKPKKYIEKSKTDDPEVQNTYLDVVEKKEDGRTNIKKTSKKIQQT
jgi:hypothetical protein